MFRVLSKNRWQPKLFSLRSRFFSEELPPPFEKILKCEIPDFFTSLISEDHEQSSLLKAIKTASILDISAAEEGGIQAMTLSDNLILDKDSVMPSTLYIRDFYPRLFESLQGSKRSILLGNPGISKSMFQWYMIYRLVSEDVSLNKSRPEVIIRQFGVSNFTFVDMTRFIRTQQMHIFLNSSKMTQPCTCLSPILP